MVLLMMLRTIVIIARQASLSLVTLETSSELVRREHSDVQHAARQRVQDRAGLAVTCESAFHVFILRINFSHFTSTSTTSSPKWKVLISDATLFSLKLYSKAFGISSHCLLQACHLRASQFCISPFPTPHGFPGKYLRYLLEEVCVPPFRPLLFQATLPDDASSMRNLGVGADFHGIHILS